MVTSTQNWNLGAGQAQLLHREFLPALQCQYQDPQFYHRCFVSTQPLINTIELEIFVFGFYTCGFIVSETWPLVCGHLTLNLPLEVKCTFLGHCQVPCLPCEGASLRWSGLLVSWEARADIESGVLGAWPFWACGFVLSSQARECRCSFQHLSGIC